MAERYPFLRGYLSCLLRQGRCTINTSAVDRETRVGTGEQQKRTGGGGFEQKQICTVRAKVRGSRNAYS